MIKDLSWLKKEVRHHLEIYDEYLSRGQGLNSYNSGRCDASKGILELIDQVEGSELPTIPDYVADYIVYLKAKEKEGSNVSDWHSLSKLKKEGVDLDKSKQWKKENYKEFCLAYAIGYEIKEKKYKVGDFDDSGFGYVLVKRNGRIGFYTHKVMDASIQKDSLLTEEEIKGFKKGVYWPVAKPVKE